MILPTTLADQVVNQNAGVGFAAVEHEGRLALDVQRGIDAGHQPLAGGFFIAGGPVDLSGEIEAGDALHGQRMIEFGCVDGVVLDGVSGTEHFRIFQAGDGAQHGGLDIHRQGGGHAVDVDLMRVQPFRLEKKLMLQLLWKADDLIFNRRTVARAGRLNLPGIHGRAMHILANDGERFRRGEGDVATDLRPSDGFGAKAERRGFGVAGLLVKLRPIDGAAVDAWRGSRLEAAIAQAQALQGFAEKHGCGLPAATGGIMLFAAVDEAIQECSGGDDGRAGVDDTSVAQLDSADDTMRCTGGCVGQFFQDDIDNFRLLDVEVRLGLQNFAHLDAVLLLVALRSRGPDGGPAGSIEQTELNADRVGDFAHHAAQRIDFAHQMTLGNSADRGIAGHLRDQVEIQRKQRGAQAHAGTRHGGFAACVAGADDDEIVLFREGHRPIDCIVRVWVGCSRVSSGVLNLSA